MIGFAAAAPPQTLVQIPNFHQHNPPNPQFLNAIITTTIEKRKKKKKNVCPLSAYKRIPMEASGAYQLVDVATGEKFIVLGGTQDDNNGDDEVSQEALDWNTTTTTNSNNNPKEAILIGGSLPSLARLKAPKVKSLINKNKSSKTRTSSSSISVPEAPKIEPLTQNDNENEEVAAQEHGDASINPRVYASNLRGWSAASISDNDRNVNSVARFKHQRKRMEGESGFFSRKSFKQLGVHWYDMLEVLRSLSFLRPSHIQILVDCSGDGVDKNPETAFLNKKSALLQLAEESPVPKTIVFCNKIETCRKVENVLNRFDRKGLHIKVLPFHAALAQDIRLTNMKEFLNSKAKDSMFLICTDRASRGIDFPNVDHVVLFDFPRDPSEYVRRVGRTARGAGGTGKAFVFVVGKHVSLARRIMERNKKGHPLHDVPSAYELESSIL